MPASTSTFSGVSSTIRMSVSFEGDCTGQPIYKRSGGNSRCWMGRASSVRGRRANFLGGTPRNPTRGGCALQGSSSNNYQPESPSESAPKESAQKCPKTGGISRMAARRLVLWSPTIFGNSATGAESSATITSFVRAKRARYGCRSSCQCAIRRARARRFFHSILPRPHSRSQLSTWLAEFAARHSRNARVCCTEIKDRRDAHRTETVSLHMNRELAF